MIGFHQLLFCLFVKSATSFSSPQRVGRQRCSQDLRLFSSEPNDQIDSLRLMLEAAWDSDTMGQVPSDANIAANEAFSSILSASDRGVSIFFIDLLLPAFDVTQGSNLYDEVLCVEYCIGLAECFKDKSRILVRDKKTVDTVQRILDRREKERLQSVPVQHDDDEIDDPDTEDIDEIDSSEDELDDEVSPTSDLDSFRQQLALSWESSAVGDTGGGSSEKVDEATARKDVPSKSKERKVPEKRYQLASMFGDTKISQGADMMQEVVTALRRHAIPDDDEKNIIILSAIAMDEMVAVRSLASRYAGERNIILVNCKLNPIPRELYGAETVYSMLPLIARAKDTMSQTISRESEIIPKTVVLRRYPGDWQVFVDMGRGFALANTAPSDLSNRRGPPMKWIQQSVQDFVRRYSK